ncbi:MAG TPA: TldD/PmbA family protein [Patescibacteria group bacterium]|nr:TldD/PmbA family protein [Patescibacteria group bacterium]
MDLDEIAKTALDALELAHVTYGDIKVGEYAHEHIATKDGVVEAMESNITSGYGIRVVKDGRWGFAASNDMTNGGIYAAVKKAIELTQAAKKITGEDVSLTEEKAIKAVYKTPYKEDPFAVSFDEKVKLLLAADEAQRRVKNIRISQSYYTGWKQKKLFASTEGSWITQDLLECGGGIEATAVSDTEVQNRSFPNSFRGQFVTGGFEHVRKMGLVEHGEQIASEAMALLTADECPAGDMDIILDGNQLALQIHESCGHATEGDRALGWEASYAGTTFLTPDKLGTFRYGSDIVNLTADATVPLGLGTFGYDDEGVPAQRKYLIKNGIFVDYQTSREVASILQRRVPGYNKSSGGTVRSDGWGHLPMIRMTNINLEPGGEGEGAGRAWTPEELIADTKHGIFFSTNKSWSIDDKRQNFQFGTEIAWEIINGKLGRMLKNATYAGITQVFWGSCDAICGRDHWVVWGTPNCGKGQPPQLMHTGHGAAPARFRAVHVGVVAKQ